VNRVNECASSIEAIHQKDAGGNCGSKIAVNSVTMQRNTRREKHDVSTIGQQGRSDVVVGA